MNGRGRTQEILQHLASSTTANADLPTLLVQLCASTLPVSGVGLTLMTAHDDPAGLVAATDGVAGVLEQLQFTVGEGPCIEASRSGRPVLAADLSAASNVDATRLWPVFTPHALQAGIAAIFAFPLRVGAIRIGVLNLYRDQSGDLEETEVAEAMAFAAAAISILLHVQDHPAMDQSDDHARQGSVIGQPLLTGPGLTLEETGGFRRLPDGDDAVSTPPTAKSDRDRRPWAIPLLDDRAVVHQGTGFVSVTAAVSLTHALVLLRAHAFTTERSVIDVAEDIVTGRLRIGPDLIPRTPPERGWDS